MNKFTKTLVKSDIHEEILKIIKKDICNPLANHEERESLTLCSYSMDLEDKLTKLGLHCTGIEKDATYFYKGRKTIEEKGIPKRKLDFKKGDIGKYLQVQRDENKIKNYFTWLDYCGPLSKGKIPHIHNAIQNCVDGGYVATTSSMNRWNRIGIGENHKNKAIKTAIYLAKIAREEGKYIKVIKAIAYQTHKTPMLFLMFQVCKGTVNEINIADQVKAVFKRWKYFDKERYIQG